MTHNYRLDLIPLLQLKGTDQFQLPNHYFLCELEMGRGVGMCCDEVFPFRAAFQYGIKMSEGRKTRRFKETNEKAELDRQWKKISAVSSITQIGTDSKLEPDRYWMFGANTVINIRKKNIQILIYWLITFLDLSSILMGYISHHVLLDLTFCLVCCLFCSREHQ